MSEPAVFLVKSKITIAKIVQQYCKTNLSVRVSTKEEVRIGNSPTNATVSQLNAGKLPRIQQCCFFGNCLNVSYISFNGELGNLAFVPKIGFQETKKKKRLPM